MKNKAKTAATHPELQERTVVLVKPDGVMRGLIGEVISRFEKAGLKLVALRMVQIDRDFAGRHQPTSEEWMKGIGGKTLSSYEKYGRDAKKELGTNDPLEIGKMVANWNLDYLTSGPIVSMIWEGHNAIDIVRKMIGNTLPVFALPGTIRGDFAKDSPALANAMKRGIRNVVHASGNKEEAANEISLWFGPEDIHEYERADWAAMFGLVK
ncbi:MAG: nucleoside-diphosphate kinase [Candidatus Andersenbacteria bacterium]